MCLVLLICWWVERGRCCLIQAVTLAPVNAVVSTCTDMKTPVPAGSSGLSFWTQVLGGEPVPAIGTEQP